MSERKFAQELDQAALDFHLKNLDGAGKTKFVTDLLQNLFENLEDYSAGDLIDLQALFDTYRDLLETQRISAFSEKLKLRRIVMGFSAEIGKPRNEFLFINWNPKNLPPVKKTNNTTTVQTSKKFSSWSE